jgi:hypothetical protein
VATLKDLESGNLAERRYVAKRYVYLESEEDVQILAERWFNDRGAKVEFQAKTSNISCSSSFVCSGIRLPPCSRRCSLSSRMSSIVSTDLRRRSWGFGNAIKLASDGDALWERLEAATRLARRKSRLQAAPTA